MVNRTNPSSLHLCFLLVFVRSDWSPDVPGMRVYHTEMTAKLAEQTKELNSTLLKIIERRTARLGVCRSSSRVSPASQLHPCLSYESVVTRHFACFP
jgi:hypothetical protein